MPIPVAAMMFGAAAGLQLSQGVSSYIAGQRSAKIQEKLADYQQTLGERQADQLEIQSGQALAHSQRRLAELRRQERLVQSTLTNRAAAAGIDPGSPGLVNLSGDIATRAELMALTEKASGGNEAKSLDFAASMARIQAAGQKEQALQQAALQRAQAQSALVRGISGAGLAAGSGYLSGAFTPAASGPKFFQGGTIGSQSMPAPMFVKYGG